MTSDAHPHIAGQTDIGMLRAVNEDAFLADNNASLYAVADGMGGHGSGDIAAKLALETLHHCITADNVKQALMNRDISDSQALALVSQCIADVNQTIHNENIKAGHQDGTGMGTTLVGLCKFGQSDKAVIFNVGDSRLYKHTGGILQQLTTDHTMYQDWEDGGKLGPAPPRNIIMRALGLFAEVELDIDVMAYEPDASYLLCSDGLTGMVHDEVITNTLGASNDPVKTNQMLIDAANDVGGNDNITVITLHPGSG